VDAQPAAQELQAAAGGAKLPEALLRQVGLHKERPCPVQAHLTIPAKELASHKRPTVKNQIKQRCHLGAEIDQASGFPRTCTHQ
jgi:hypothetical protein